jgi:hypothetical protein
MHLVVSQVFWQAEALAGGWQLGGWRSPAIRTQNMTRHAWILPIYRPRNLDFRFSIDNTRHLSDSANAFSTSDGVFARVVIAETSTRYHGGRETNIGPLAHPFGTLVCSGSRTTY